jgi:hypothetical protein
VAFRHQLIPLAHDDEDHYDLSKGMPDDWEPPEYPGGCQLHMKCEDLAKAGCEGGEPGDVCNFAAMCEVTSVMKSLTGGCRIELEVMLFAGEDGEFFEPSEPKPCLCLTDRELGKLDLDDDCERGDLLHIMGEARVESTSSTEYGGETCCLQVTGMDFAENESTEEG